MDTFESNETNDRMIDFKHKNCNFCQWLHVQLVF